MLVSIQELDKSAVFAALFNRAQAQGLGFLQYNPALMTAEQAQERFGECSEYFDYVLLLNMRNIGFGKVDVICKPEYICAAYGDRSFFVQRELQ